MPTNLYGEEDNFDLESSHVLPAMIRKFHEALPDKDVVLLGTGQVYREFMHVNDLAKCILFLSLRSILFMLINLPYKILLISARLHYDVNGC